MVNVNAIIRHLLWKKESSHPDALFIDYFSAALKSDFKTFVDNRLCVAQKEPIGKNDDVSTSVQNLAELEFRNKKWAEAIELYNISLCTAENESLNLRLAYQVRSTCFANRGMIEEANTDIDLSSKQLAKLSKRCSVRIQDSKSSITSTKMNKTFPSLASALEVQQNSKFGRHVVAKCDIPVGQTIAMERQFAGAVVYTSNDLNQRQAYCLTCYRTDTNFIPCPNCTSAMFCSRTCQQNNDTHQLECKSLFHYISSATVKLAIQMVLIAVKQFPNVDQLVAFVSHIITDVSDDINKLANDTFPSYGLMLKLKCWPCNSDVKRAYEAFEIMIKTMPMIQRNFDTSSSQRFLVHLLVHHFGIIRMNGFSDTFGSTKSLHCKYIHDTISLVNHSCAPNAHYTYHHQNAVGQLITVRPIKCGDQIFINYLGNEVGRLRNHRRQYLEKYWSIDNCDCDRCEPLASRSEQSKNKRNMEGDPNFQYYERNWEDVNLPAGNEKRKHLKENCAQILKKYGHIWSDELDDVTTIFIELCLN